MEVVKIQWGRPSITTTTQKANRIVRRVHRESLDSGGGPVGGDGDAGLAVSVVSLMAMVVVPLGFAASTYAYGQHYERYSVVGLVRVWREG